MASPPPLTLNHKKILCSFSDNFLSKIDFVASFEHRTRTGLIREALRRYIEHFEERNWEILKAKE